MKLFKSIFKNRKKHNCCPRCNNSKICSMDIYLTLPISKRKNMAIYIDRDTLFNGYGLKDGWKYYYYCRRCGKHWKTKYDLMEENKNEKV